MNELTSENRRHETESRTRLLGAAALQLYSISETCELLRVSRWQIYQLINSRKLPSVKINRRRLIAAADIERYVQTLRTQASP